LLQKYRLWNVPEVLVKNITKDLINLTKLLMFYTKSCHKKYKLWNVPEILVISVTKDLVNLTGLTFYTKSGNKNTDYGISQRY
jgi:hypothetical protein